MDEHWMMWLSRIEGIGIRRVRQMLAHFSTPSAIWQASKEELLQIRGLGEQLAGRILASRDEAKLESFMEELIRKDISFYSILHPSYPMLLKEIYDPPIGIYVRGTLPEDTLDAISIIGARRCTRYGAQVGHKLAKDIAKANITVVSGMARGIDAWAHQGAIDGGGKTIAVLGCGVDICYPSENRKLMADIIENGCVLSEFPPGQPPAPQNFPVRNCIISGLSRLTVVVEAARRSGTLITADQALENGREVYVVPGKVTSPLSEGTNDLIKQGCPIITNFEDVLFALGITYTEQEEERFKEHIPVQLSLEEKTVLDALGQDPADAEMLSDKLGIPVQTVQYILTLLEIGGLACHVPLAGYCKKESFLR